VAAIKKKEQIQFSQMPLVEKEIKKRKVIKKKTKTSKAKNRLKMIMTMGAIVTVTLLLLYRTAEISKMKYDLVNLNQRTTEASLQREELNVALGEIKNSEWLASEAQEKINLRKATDDQLVKLEVPKTDTSSASESNLKSFFSGLVGRFSK
jgi:hypothetical protein